MLTITVLRTTSIQPTIAGRSQAGTVIKATEEVPFEEGHPMRDSWRRFVGENGERFWMPSEDVRVTDSAWLDGLGAGDAVKVCADVHGGSRDKAFVTRRTPKGDIVIGGARYHGATGRERGGVHYLLPWTGHDERRHARPTGAVPGPCQEIASEDYY